ncbi:B12-binding domain-containing radical SAM protein [Micromonospora sp. NPDC051925]|uniref:B12-binding domain-containing radical SAM protein n=1 Tax=Micromonospora sp. NPDC051925 TaxID=3364288 RepID=UPI0037CCABA3
MSTEDVRLLDFWASEAQDLERRIELEALLQRRRDELQARQGHPGQRVPGGAIGVPVLAVLAPVVTDTEGVIEYPGDPMCLYAALQDTIAQSTAALNSQWSAREPLRDTVLDWGRLPDDAYRAVATDDGIRTPLDRRPQVADELVFDPRVWNADTRRAFRAVLTSLRPRVLLISSVSAAHRYALEMAQIARDVLPHVYIILGGRHADETMSWSPRKREVVLDASSTVSVITSGRRPAPINAVVSGAGSPLLDLLSIAVLLAMGTGHPDLPTAAEVARRMRDLRDFGWQLTGDGVVALVDAPHRAIAIPCLGSGAPPPADVTPYDPFAIRSHFTVFPAPGSGSRRTAHLLTAASCPFRCTFCSESSAVTGAGARLSGDDTHIVIQRLARLVSYRAEAAFFDDPVLWSGRWSAVEDFAEAMCEVRGLSDGELLERYAVLADPESRQRWRDLRWGGQLTVDVLLQDRGSGRTLRTLERMRLAGCSYIYIGIESMSDVVMSRVRKNLLVRDSRPWALKVREALALLKTAGIPVGTSVLFGLDGETPDTVTETIEGIGQLIDESFIAIASPNILTYHPGTAIARQHGQTDLDYHSPMRSKPPFTFFEEAYEGVSTKLLTVDDIWRIHLETEKRWGITRNESELRTYPERTESAAPERVEVTPTSSHGSTTE